MTKREEIIALLKEDEFEGLGQLYQMAEVAGPILLDILTSPSTSDFLRQRATVALGEIKMKGAANAIEQLLHHEDPVQRILAIIALTKIKGVKASPALIPLLNDPDVSVCKTTIMNLADIGNESALPHLQRIQEGHEESFLRETAEKAIQQIRTHL